MKRITYDVATARLWALYAQRVVAGVPANAARAEVYKRLVELRMPDDMDYCHAYEAHVKRVFGGGLARVK